MPAIVIDSAGVAVVPLPSLVGQWPTSEMGLFQARRSKKMATNLRLSESTPSDQHDWGSAVSLQPWLQSAVPAPE